jgi:hypothetical protein
VDEDDAAPSDRHLDELNALFKVLAEAFFGVVKGKYDLVLELPWELRRQAVTDCQDVGDAQRLENCEVVRCTD